MSETTRTFVAIFDAIAMTVLAFVVTGGTFGEPVADLVLWGSAAAAGISALVVATHGPPTVAWVAIGYILFAGLLVLDRPQLLVVSLAIALMPTVPRPRGSLALGIVIAVISAFAIRVLVPYLT